MDPAESVAIHPLEDGQERGSACNGMAQQNTFECRPSRIRRCCSSSAERANQVQISPVACISWKVKVSFRNSQPRPTTGPELWLNQRLSAKLHSWAVRVLIYPFRRSHIQRARSRFFKILSILIYRTARALLRDIKITRIGCVLIKLLIIYYWSLLLPPPALRFARNRL